MILARRQGFALFLPPKTGTTSVVHHLTAHPCNRMGVVLRGRHTPRWKSTEDLSGLDLYSIVRSPWDWYVSWWHYHFHGRFAERSSARVKLGSQIHGRDDFAAVLPLIVGSASRSMSRSARANWDGVPGFADDVTYLRTERLTQDLAELCQQYALPAPEGARKNVGGRPRDLTSLYTPDMIALVLEKDAAMIDRFSYQRAP